MPVAVVKLGSSIVAEDNGELRLSVVARITEEVAARIRKVIEVVPPERVYLTTDCGMKPLARIVARMKLKALADGARIVRKELGHA